MCTTLWNWLERADRLRAAVGEDASCGVEPGYSEWVLLQAAETRIRAMQPHADVDRCLKLYDFFEGYRASALLPATSIGSQLGEVEKILWSLEQAWLLDDESEVRELLPHAVGALRNLEDWTPTAQRAAEAVASIDGVLLIFDQANPLPIVQQMQEWGTMVEVALAQTVRMPDVTDALSRLKSMIEIVFPRVEKVAETMAGVGAQVDSMLSVLDTLQIDIAALQPQTAFAALNG